MDFEFDISIEFGQFSSGVKLLSHVELPYTLQFLFVLVMSNLPVWYRNFVKKNEQNWKNHFSHRFPTEKSLKFGFVLKMDNFLL